MNHCVYILHSIKLNRYYIGFTTNFDTRPYFHLNSDEQRKFTHNANDWTTFIKIECQSKTQALPIESHIKKMKSKVYIENLLLYPEITEKLYGKHKDC
jgi:putative endonuclease